jgi:hypothetical protein
MQHIGVLFENFEIFCFLTFIATVSRPFPWSFGFPAKWKLHEKRNGIQFQKPFLQKQFLKTQLEKKKG